MLNDEESLKKENITFDSSSINFDENNKKINLKQKIENEINNINILYDNTNKEVTLFYEEKHKKLYEEENQLIEKLQNEVTKIKEKLENFLSECYRIIRINEKLYKGIKKIKEEKENNMRKKLSYISTINKNQKEINELLKQPMSNLKINFEKDKNTIKYEEYYFNLKQWWKPSNILNENDAKLIVSWLPNNPKEIQLLFNTQKDGDFSSTFHDKCDGKYPTLILIKSNIGYIFGGYVTAAWNSNNNAINAPNSFIFSLNQKSKYYASSEQNSIINGGNRNNQQGTNMFKIGCCDITIQHNCTKTNQNGTNCDKFSVPSQNILNGGNRYFTVSNLEVYEIKY